MGDIRTEESERYDLLKAGALAAGVESPNPNDFDRAVKAWLAWDESSLVGGVGLFLHADCYAIDYLFTNTAHRGKGIGVSLVRAAIKYAKTQGIDKICLFTKIPEYFSRSFSFEPMPEKLSENKFQQYVYRNCLLCDEFRKGCKPVSMVLAL